MRATLAVFMSFVVAVVIGFMLTKEREPRISADARTVVPLSSGKYSREAAAGARPVETTVGGGLDDPLEQIARALRRSSGQGQVLDVAQSSTRVPELIVAAEGGAASAALSLHWLSSSCNGLRQPALDHKNHDCRVLNKSLQHSPFRWLLVAASFGHPDAMIPMLGVARDLRYPGHDAQLAEEMASATIAELRKYALRGELEAFKLISAVYADGLLTQADPVQEYCHLSLYARATQDIASVARSARLWTLLRISDRNQASSCQLQFLSLVTRPTR